MSPINLIWQTIAIRFAMMANHVIFFLRTIPGIKKIIPATLYKNGALKVIFTVLAVLFIINKRILFRFLFMIVLVASGLLAQQIFLNGGIIQTFGDFSQINFSFHLPTLEGIQFILTTWIIGACLGAFSLGSRIDISNYKMMDTLVNYLRVNPSKYRKVTIFYDALIHWVLYVPYLILAIFIGRLPILSFLTLSLGWLAFRFAGETLNLWLFERSGKHFGMKGLSWVNYVVLALAFVIPAHFGTLNWSLVLVNPISILAMILLGGLSIFYLVKFDHYLPIINERIAFNATVMTDLKKGFSDSQTASNASVKKWSKDIKSSDLQSKTFHQKKGFEYLNAIFFHRHRHLFRKSLNFRLMVILIMGVLLSLATVIFRMNVGMSPLQFFGIDERTLLYFVPIAFYVIYWLSMGRIITAGIFSNCDIQMLHYQYYRTKETTLASFKARVFVILKNNLILTTALSFSVILVFTTMKDNFDPFTALIIFVLFTALGIFFGFSDLFLYYIIQPYNEKGQSKSVVYTIINTVVMMAAGAKLTTRISFYPYAIVMIGLTFIFLVIGSKLLSVYAPRNFKLR